ncbi:MAG: tRNA uridine(34) 5-carboxymethylaminomethyl modification radical SAM/GNAT enzyme Elp3 [Candidatus Parcubacteria bacterium]|jgi:elongator complex protein 3|nr:MAG: tRNA uridine(34) 5-carboxymethylaminomethyl modification radical SAM/GNAT enzyme Elp3 [Candidatus Parcubacteria bacterium]
MEEAIIELILKSGSRLESRDDLSAVKRDLCKRYHLKSISNSEVFKIYRELKLKNSLPRELNQEKFERLLRKRSVRTLSGVAPVAVLTKPYPCPGSCAYCPNEPGVPVSYLPNEPAVMRALRCKFNPYWQTLLRLQSLEENGHYPTKIELIVIGGTWSYLPDRYQYWFILSCFRAANDFARLKKGKYWQAASRGGWFKLLKKIPNPYPQKLALATLKKSLKQEQRKNEQATYQIIGLTLETRPDYIDKAELAQMVELGCTRVEIGVQAPDDEILRLNCRGHGVIEIVKASAGLRDYGLKITYHIMPALPGSTPAKDLALFKLLFTDANFQPDQIKFYPTVVTRGSRLYEWWRQGKYQPYSDEKLRQLIIDCKAVVPEYVRIIRLIRDIPGESIIAGNKITNLRQVMQQAGVKCGCIRCREIKDLRRPENYQISQVSYEASGGWEYFIQAESLDRKTLYGFCRLRLSSNSKIAPALIRELHVYGELVPVGGVGRVQHRGLGKELLKTAEKIAARAGAKQLAISAGVGVRDYYRKQGYRLLGAHMVKRLKTLEK